MSLLYVANWKMQFTFDQARAWLDQHSAELAQLATKHQIALCPSYIALSDTVQKFSALNSTNLYLGAQNCSMFEQGPYTGEVSAPSLKQVGCSFCIIGHSERRLLLHETFGEVALKTSRVLEAQMIPIICVGETKEQHKAGKSQETVQEELTPIFKRIKDSKQPIYIAYEPVWAIGTGTTPEPQTIELMFSFIKKLGHLHAPNLEIKLLYGGSVNGSNSAQFKQIKLLDGFLIGGASLDFQELKKIVV